MSGLNNFKERAIGEPCTRPCTYPGRYASSLMSLYPLLEISGPVEYITRLAAEYVKQAVAEDTSGNWQSALDHYKQSLECFLLAIKYEKNPRSRDAITSKASPRSSSLCSQQQGQGS